MIFMKVIYTLSKHFDREMSIIMNNIYVLIERLLQWTQNEHDVKFISQCDDSKVQSKFSLNWI